MPYPDWVEGKQQFSGYDVKSDSGTILAAETKSILDYDGSGELLYGLYRISGLDHIFSAQDRFYLYIDGIQVEDSWWEYMLQKPLDNTPVFVVPGNYNEFGEGSVYLKPNIQFTENITLNYRNTTGAVYTFNTRSVMGLY